MTNIRSQSADILLALPIEGESFLLRRAGKNVLVDGGYKKDNISAVLKRHIHCVRYLDIVVCTHGDRDHVGGLPDLLESWADRVGQLWLPGQWVNVIPQLVCDPAEFFSQLVRELDAELKNPSEMVASAVYHADGERLQRGDWRNVASPSQTEDMNPAGEEWSDQDGGSIDPKEPLPEPGWFVALRTVRSKLANDDKATHAFKSARREVEYRQERPLSDLRIRISRYWLDLIETSKAIRDIAMIAIKREIPTRWFDFDGFSRTRSATGGDRGFLVPVNAVEQATPPTVLPLFMHLTKINQESLVFFAPPTGMQVGVLFCADSPLGYGKDFSRSFLSDYPVPKSHWPIVATAPHHGSESNKIAYTHLHKWASVAVLLRAGGSEKQPGSTFLSQQNCLRLCAKCPKAGHAPTLSGVYLSRPYFNRYFGTRCNCRFR